MRVGMFCFWPDAIVWKHHKQKAPWQKPRRMHETKAEAKAKRANAKAKKAR